MSKIDSLWIIVNDDVLLTIEIYNLFEIKIIILLF